MKSMSKAQLSVSRPRPADIEQLQLGEKNNNQELSGLRFVQGDSIDD
ncbi:hypothetical protein [Bradyrhizobium sp. NBAIM08]|nr:hypothetical protein [Bradyrhizobium sp. NBAIM08]